jgi:glutamine cyclotransferase
MIKTKKNKNNLKKLVFSLLILFIIIFSIIFYFNSNKEIKPMLVKEIPYDYRISQHLGLIVDNDSLHFGTMMYGGSATREITLNTKEDFFVKIRYEGNGNIAVNENNFILEKNINKTLEFKVDGIKLAFGNYSGMVFIEFYDPHLKTNSLNNS